VNGGCHVLKNNFNINESAVGASDECGDMKYSGGNGSA
jgi:hypothetical protein